MQWSTAEWGGFFTAASAALVLLVKTQHIMHHHSLMNMSSALTLEPRPQGGVSMVREPRPSEEQPGSRQSFPEQGVRRGNLGGLLIIAALQFGLPVRWAVITILQ